MGKCNLEILYEGDHHKICAIVEDGKCPIRDFIDSLSGPAQKSILALLKRTAENGRPINKEKFQKLTDYDLFEFKDYQTRIFCAFDKDKLIILTHGFIKKKDKTPKSQITKAFDLLNKYRQKR